MDKILQSVGWASPLEEEKHTPWVKETVDKAKRRSTSNNMFLNFTLSGGKDRPKFS